MAAAGSRNSCLKFAAEGERRYAAGDKINGIKYLEHALTVGTDDLMTLDSVYMQLGNAYAHAGDYVRAFQYHWHDLTIARTLGDKIGESTANGNLANTLKALGKYDEAIICCQRQLELCRELGDRAGEGKAFYKLANMHHAKGRQIARLVGSPCTSDFPLDVKASLHSAVEYYKANLSVVESLGDKVGEGRACGNLGNAYHHLEMFQECVVYQQRRLNIAEHFGDKVAMRRTYTNLGNAHVFLGDFLKAIECYTRALELSVEMADDVNEAEACHSLGYIWALNNDYSQAIAYHQRHLRIARRTRNAASEQTALLALGTAFTDRCDEPAKALYFFMLHMKVSHDKWLMTASPGSFETPSAPLRTLDGGGNSVNASSDASRRAVSVTSSVAPSFDVTQIGPSFTESTAESEEESFFDMISRMQGKRIDDQRCDARAILQINKENRPNVRPSDSLKPGGSEEEEAAVKKKKRRRSSVMLRDAAGNVTSTFARILHIKHSSNANGGDIKTPASIGRVGSHSSMMDCQGLSSTPLLPQPQKPVRSSLTQDRAQRQATVGEFKTPASIGPIDSTTTSMVDTQGLSSTPLLRKQHKPVRSSLPHDRDQKLITVGVGVFKTPASVGRVDLRSRPHDCNKSLPSAAGGSETARVDTSTVGDNNGLLSTPLIQQQHYPLRAFDGSDVMTSSLTRDGDNEKMCVGADENNVTGTTPPLYNELDEMVERREKRDANVMVAALRDQNSECAKQTTLRETVQGGDSAEVTALQGVDQNCECAKVMATSTSVLTTAVELPGFREWGSMPVLAPPRHSPVDDLFDMVIGMKAGRVDEQRSDRGSYHLPGLQSEKDHGALVPPQRNEPQDSGSIASVNRASLSQSAKKMTPNRKTGTDGLASSLGKLGASTEDC